MRHRPVASRSEGEQSHSRRQLLAVGAALGTSALAGCTGAVNFVGNKLLDDVVLTNVSQRSVDGTITVVEPGGETALDSSFSFSPGEESSAKELTFTTRGGVFTGAGEYEVGVELDIFGGGTASATGTANVANIEEEHIAVIVGAGEDAGSVRITVVEDIEEIRQAVEQTNNGA